MEIDKFCPKSAKNKLENTVLGLKRMQILKVQKINEILNHNSQLRSETNEYKHLLNVSEARCLKAENKEAIIEQTIVKNKELNI